MAMGCGPASWWDWVVGLLVVIWDALSQRIATVTLPPRLPITPLSHLTCVVTSCSPGVALETAKHLAQSGARVVLAVADTDAARELVASWELGDHVDQVPPLNCEVMEMDCLSLDSVRKFAVNWEARGLPLNALINIGSTSCVEGPHERTVSKDGFARHMQVNHLAPALLTLLLLPSLLRGSPSRVVMVNSVVHHLGHLDSENLNLSGNKKRHNKLTSYANSKLAQLLFSNLLQRRLPREAGVDIICVHPGQVTTKVATGARGILLTPLYLLSPVEGARSVLFCATDQQVQDYARALRGLSYPLAPYFGSDCKPCSVARQVHDTDKANLVWQETLSTVGMPVECVEVAVRENDPPDVDMTDMKYMQSFPAVSNGEDFEFLLENGDDVDEFFHGADN